VKDKRIVISDFEVQPQDLGHRVID